MIRKFILCILSAALFSCQDVVDLEVPDTVNSIAISGRVSDKEATFVQISSTSAYFDQGKTPRISDARVWLLEDGDTISTLLPDSLPGLYSSPFTGTIGKSYEILVEIKDNPQFRNSNWRSYPETMKRVCQIDSIGIKFLDRNTIPQAFYTGHYAMMYFKEPKGKGDHYRVRRWKNDSLFHQDIFVFNDDNIDGAYFGKGGIFPGFAYYGPFSEEEKDSSGVEISSISKEYFKYLNLVNEQVFQVGSTFDPPPQTIIGNIYNADDPEEYGFGYFGASAISKGGISYEP